MTRKKNGFWAFVFSLLPGAGEMYMGFMKQGVSLMGLFFTIVFLASWVNIGPLLFALPVVWCYGFFHVHALRSMPDEEFYAQEDDYLFHLGAVFRPDNVRARNILAVCFIFLGSWILLRHIVHIASWALPGYIVGRFWQFWDFLPQLVIAVLLIVAGIRMISGKKRELDGEERKEAGFHPGTGDNSTYGREGRD